MALVLYTNWSSFTFPLTQIYRVISFLNWVQVLHHMTPLYLCFVQNWIYQWNSNIWTWKLEQFSHWIHLHHETHLFFSQLTKFRLLMNMMLLNTIARQLWTTDGRQVRIKSCSYPLPGLLLIFLINATLWPNKRPIIM